LIAVFSTASAPSIATTTMPTARRRRLRISAAGR